MMNPTVQVLLADDDEDDRLLFQTAFEELKIKTNVRTLNDGKELMDYLQQPHVVVPNVLFLDLNMPIKNGLQCLAEIKLLPHLDNMAVAIYSTSSSEADIETAFVKGANVYIKKPSDFIQLKKVLQAVVTLNWQYQTSGLNRDNFLFSI
jgi:CheY-like chemotaxis protein